jgi:hypothetical protein
MVCYYKEKIKQQHKTYNKHTTNMKLTTPHKKRKHKGIQLALLVFIILCVGLTGLFAFQGIHPPTELTAHMHEQAQQEKGETYSFALTQKQSVLARTLQKTPASIEITTTHQPKNVQAKIQSYKQDNHPGTLTTQVVAVENAAVQEATITLPKTGNVNRILQCADEHFDMNTFECKHWEITNIPFKDDGETITFTVEHFSAYVGGDIKAVEALHLNINESLIGSIFEEVKEKDNTWSPPIYTGETVRVTYERNLTNGSTIDVYVRSNHTYAYFDIYEAGTHHKVGRSGIAGRGEMQYMQVHNLRHPTTQFDFRVVKVINEEENASSRFNPERVAFLEFDYIHDDVINSTQADGLLVYNQLNTQTPQYREYNESNNFTSEQADALSVGADINWVVTRASHERDEMIMGTEDQDNDVNIQVLHANNSWIKLLEVSTENVNDNSRSFDIAYEDISGDAFIIYENSSAGTNNGVAYRFWNGTSYTSETRLDTTLPDDPIRWISATPRTGSDQIMVLLHSNSGDLHGVLWNGTGFSEQTRFNLSLSTTSNTEEHFDFEWEGSSGDGLVAYGTGTSLQVRTFSQTAPHWSTETGISGSGVDATRLCSEPSSDYIGIIWQDGGNDVQVRMWDGTQLLASPPSQESQTEPNGANSANIDCGWYNSSHALFSFVDFNDLTLNFFNFTKDNTWSTSDLTTTATTASIGLDDVQTVRYTEHPTTQEIMLTIIDLDTSVLALRWNGSHFNTFAQSPFEGTSETTDQEGAMFDWERFDPNPTVNNFSINYSTNVSPKTDVNLTINVTDNINVSFVYVNVTLPNGTRARYNMSNQSADGLYNMTFTNTTVLGRYNLTFYANDTSTHHNINSTVTGFFNVSDENNPNVFNNSLVNSTEINAGGTVNLTINFTDDLKANNISINVTLPNGTRRSFNMSKFLGNRYQFNFTNTSVVGNYNVTYIGNDSAGNNNATTKSNFSVVDTLAPLVTTTIPSNDTSFNISEVIQVAVTVNDNDTVTNVTANITFVNGSIRPLNLSKVTGTSKYNTSLTAPRAKGTNNITFLANDTSGNENGTVKALFIIGDTFAPTLTGLIPVNATLFDNSTVIEIAVNASDQDIVENVTANVTLPNGSIVPLNFSQFGTTAKYNVSFTLLGLGGKYNVTFAVNDTSNNINGSEKITLTEKDVVKPLVFALVPVNDTSFNVSEVMEVAANVTDNLEVANVTANITFVNGSRRELNLSQVGTGNKYNTSFRIPDSQGTNNITYFANDTSNNINTSSVSRFIIGDTLAPTVDSLIPSNNSEFFIADIFEIAATIVDNASVNSTLANVTSPNGTIHALTLSQVSGTNKYNTSFTVPNVVGKYNITYFANDSNGNENSTLKANFSVDATPPLVFALLPANNSVFNTSNFFEIAANATDNNAVGNVTANVSYPNGTRRQLNLSQVGTGNKYNVTFVAPNRTGKYNITFIANDTSGNLNTTGKTNFTVNDVDTLTLTVLGCVPGDGNLTNSITCNATAVDDLAVYNVTANVTLPNGSRHVQNVTNVSSNFFITFPNTTNHTGQYNIVWQVNDTSNNIRTNTSGNFNITDRVNTSILLNGPVNRNNNTGSVTFNFTAIDNFNLTGMNCTVRADGTLNTSNTSTKNGTPTLISITGFSNGNHTWNVSCSDGPNVNVSATRNFTTDLGEPQFINLTTNPAGDAKLDPNVNVNVTAFVLDNTTQVHTVILQRKLSSEEDASYVNITMDVLIAPNTYNATFNASDNGTYNLRIFANDTLGNSDFSALTNISVQTDKTWTRAPSAFSAVNSDIDGNVSVGNLTINNTGDLLLSFNITAETGNVTYNGTENFSLASGDYKTILITANASNIGVTTMRYNITSNGTPLNQTSTGSVVVADGQPVITTTFTVPTAEILEKQQGDSVELTAEVKNIGEDNASNVSLFFVIPSNWTVTSGDVNTTYETLVVGDTESSTIRATIPTTYPVGSLNVFANATGFNETSTDLKTLGFIFGDRVNVTVGALVLGKQQESGGGTSSASSSKSVSVSSKGGPVVKKKVGTGETIHTTETIAVVRGRRTSVPITITNVYKNAHMEDIHVALEGFMSQYVTLTPVSKQHQRAVVESVDVGLAGVNSPFKFTLGKEEHTITTTRLKQNSATFVIQSEPTQVSLNIGGRHEVDLDGDTVKDAIVELHGINNQTEMANLTVHKLGPSQAGRLHFGESMNYTLTMEAPAYLSQEEYELTAKIMAKLVAVDQVKAGFTWKPIIEIRKIAFQVLTLSKEEAKTELEKALAALEAMEEAGFPLKRLQEIISKVEEALKEDDYTQAKKLTDQALQLKENAFEADELMQEVHEMVKEAKEQWLKVPETESALLLAHKAFDREDFTTALQRAKDTQLTFILETKGRINLVWFILTYWWAIILIGIAGSVGSFYAYKHLSIAIINQRMKNIAKEEVSLRELMQKAQEEHFKGRTSSSTYHKTMVQYEDRLTKIKQVRARLRNKRVSILQTQQEMENLDHEEQEIKGMMKKVQEDYLLKGTVSRRKFTAEYTADKERIAEVEEQKEVVKRKLNKLKLSRWYPLMNWLNEQHNKISRYFREKRKVTRAEKAKPHKITLLQKEHEKRNQEEREERVEQEHEEKEKEEGKEEEKREEEESRKEENKREEENGREKERGGKKEKRREEERGKEPGHPQREQEEKEEEEKSKKVEEKEAPEEDSKEEAKKESFLVQEEQEDAKNKGQGNEEYRKQEEKEEHKEKKKSVIFKTQKTLQKAASTIKDRVKNTVKETVKGTVKERVEEKANPLQLPKPRKLINFVTKQITFKKKQKKKLSPHVHELVQAYERQEQQDQKHQEQAREKNGEENKKETLTKKRQIVQTVSSMRIPPSPGLQRKSLLKTFQTFPKLSQASQKVQQALGITKKKEQQVSIASKKQTIQAVLLAKHNQTVQNQAGQGIKEESEERIRPKQEKKEGQYYESNKPRA